jgi:hypothetical protein
MSNLEAMTYSECQPAGLSSRLGARKSHQFLVAFAALGKMRHLVYRRLSMLVRHKFSLPEQTPGYGISLKKAYMPLAVPPGAPARNRSRLSETRTKR